MTTLVYVTASIQKQYQCSILSQPSKSVDKQCTHKVIVHAMLRLISGPDPDERFTFQGSMCEI